LSKYFASKNLTTQKRKVTKKDTINTCSIDVYYIMKNYY